MRKVVSALVLRSPPEWCWLPPPLANSRANYGEISAEAASGHEGGQAPAPAQPAVPPRGSRHRPSMRPSEPINNLPNPYETIRNFGTLPDGRRWGSVSAVHVDIDGKHIWAGDRCGGNVCLNSKVESMRQARSGAARLWRASAPARILWPHGMDVDRQGNIWVADARSATPQELAKFPMPRARAT